MPDSTAKDRDAPASPPSTAPELATNQCRTCGDVKPLSEFHRSTSHRSGYRNDCKDCAKAKVYENQAEWRALLGDEAYNRRKRVITANSRRRTGNASGRAYGRAQSLAVAVLRERHRKEYDHLLLLARRGELTRADIGDAGAHDAPTEGSGK